MALDAERARASFDVGILRRIVRGSDEEQAQMAEWRQAFDIPLFDNSDDSFLPMSEAYLKTYERGLKSMDIIRQNKKILAAHSPVHGGNPAKLQIGEISNTHSSISFHYSLFVATILTQGSPEQQREWLPRSLKLQIVGCYAQTELGHGSNVRGIETTATFDESTDEFVIHSPNLTSTKWWISAGGIAATHAIVYAQLILKGVNHGYHAFIVQLRDENHRPLAGVTVGHLGPKMGGHDGDTGFMRFDRVRIARENMLSRFQQVSRTGEYIKAPKNLSKIGYLTMTQTRVGITRGSAKALAAAVVIAIRWNAIRKQGFALDGGETTIIDYKNQQYFLFGHLSVAYAISLGSVSLARLLRAFSDELREKGANADTSSLPELHATSSGLKGFCADYAASGMESVRRCCGGQGYALSSGIGTLLLNYLPAVTYEGDRNILALQSAKFLVQSLQKHENLIAGMEYLKSTSLPRLHCEQDAFNVESLISVWEGVAKHSVERAAADIERATAASHADPWNVSQISLVDSAQHHCILTLLRGFHAEANRVADSNTRAVLMKLAALFSLFMLWEKARSIDVAAVLNSTQLGYCQSAMNSLLEQIRPDAVALCDAWGFTDKQLNSCIGRYDGKAYEAVYDWATRSPLNKPEVVDRVAALLQPYLDRQFLAQGNSYRPKL